VKLGRVKRGETAGKSYKTRKKGCTLLLIAVLLTYNT
jgi:hypothetical protein